MRTHVFGEEERFIRHLGTYLSVFSAPNHLNLDHWQVFHQGPVQEAANAIQLADYRS